MIRNERPRTRPRCGLSRAVILSTARRPVETTLGAVLWQRGSEPPTSANDHPLTLPRHRRSFGAVVGSTADTAVKGEARRRAGALAGLVAGPFFLISVGLNTWASIDYLHQLGWEFVGGEQVPWPSSLARGPYGWTQAATFVVTGLLIVILAIAVRDQLPRRRAAASRSSCSHSSVWR